MSVCSGSLEHERPAGRRACRPPPGARWRGCGSSARTRSPPPRGRSTRRTARGRRRGSPSRRRSRSRLVDLLGSAPAARVPGAASSPPRRPRRGRSSAGAALRGRRGARARRRPCPRARAPGVPRPPGRARRRRAPPAGRRDRRRPRPRPPTSGWRPLGTWSSSMGNESTSVGPVPPRKRALRSVIAVLVDEDQRHLGVGAAPLLGQHQARQSQPAREVDGDVRLLVGGEDRHPIGSLAAAQGTCAADAALTEPRCRATSSRSYALTMSCTIRWRTTSWASSSTNARSGIPARMSRTASRPERPRPSGRSIWVTSPVTTILEPKPEPGEEHLHLLGRGVLRLVEDDERVVQRAAAHERERRHLDGAALHQPAHDLGLEHVVERVVERPEVRDRPWRGCRRAGSRAARPPPPRAG